MTDEAGKKTARRTMGEAVAEHDIDRLLNAARGPLKGGIPVAATAPADPFAARLDQKLAGGGRGGFNPSSITQVANAASVTLWDFPVFILYACLGVFTRIWTDVTLYFDFGEDNTFRMFAIAVSMAMHGFIIAIVTNAWRAKWEIRVRNLLAMATLGGYLGFRMLTQL